MSLKRPAAGGESCKQDSFLEYFYKLPTRVVLYLSYAVGVKGSFAPSDTSDGTAASAVCHQTSRKTILSAVPGQMKPDNGTILPVSGSSASCSSVCGTLPPIAGIRRRIISYQNCMTAHV